MAAGGRIEDPGGGQLPPATLLSPPHELVHSDSRTSQAELAISTIRTDVAVCRPIDRQLCIAAYLSNTRSPSCAGPTRFLLQMQCTTT